MAELINGKELAEKMQAEIAIKVSELKTKSISPGLVVLLVGEIQPVRFMYVIKNVPQNQSGSIQKLNVTQARSLKKRC